MCVCRKRSSLVCRSLSLARSSPRAALLVGTDAHGVALQVGLEAKNLLQDLAGFQVSHQAAPGRGPVDAQQLAGEAENINEDDPRQAANLMRKLNLRNQSDLVRYAIKRGILPLED